MRRANMHKFKYLTGMAEDTELRDRLRKLILEVAELCEWSPTKLAQEAGLTASTLTRFLNSDDISHVISSKTLNAVMDRAMTRVDELMQASPAKAPALANKFLTLSSERRHVSAAFDKKGAIAPLLVVGSVQAGIWREALEWPQEDWYPAPVGTDQRYSGIPQFALEVRGSSMDQVYPEGSIVVCIKTIDLGRDPKSGDRVIAMQRSRDGTCEATIKELAKDERGDWWLWPRSSDPNFQQPWLLTSTVESDENDDLRIVALVVGSYRPEK